MTNSMIIRGMLICTYIIAVNVNIVSLNSVAKFTKQENNYFANHNDSIDINLDRVVESNSTENSTENIDTTTKAIDNYAHQLNHKEALLNHKQQCIEMMNQKYTNQEEKDMLIEVQCNSVFQQIPYSESFSSLDNGKRVNYPKLFMSSNGNYPVINSKVIFSDKNNNTNDSKPQLSEDNHRENDNIYEKLNLRFPKDADKNFINGTYMYSKINNLTVHVYQQNSTDERN